ncbi:MAG: DUF2203 domain-containing protein [Planctomycetota bacterium]
MERIEGAASKTTRAVPAARQFTVENANASLVLVRRIVAEIVVEFRRLLDLQELVEMAEAGGDHRAGGDARRQLRETFGRLETCRDELAGMGVELRDWLRGIVHFPHEHHGQSGYLCWRHGESRVDKWHARHASFAHRETIGDDPRHPAAENEGQYHSDDGRPLA